MRYVTIRSETADEIIGAIERYMDFLNDQTDILILPPKCYHQLKKARKINNTRFFYKQEAYKSLRMARLVMDKIKSVPWWQFHRKRMLWDEYIWRVEQARRSMRNWKIQWDHERSKIYDTTSS